MRPGRFRFSLAALFHFFCTLGGRPHDAQKNKYTTSLAAVLLLLLAGCLPPGPAPAAPSAPPDAAAQAAVEATRIISEARAAALVMQAALEATAIVRQAENDLLPPTPDPNATAQPVQFLITATVPAVEDLSAAGSLEPGETEGEEEDEAYEVELVSAGYAAEGGFLIVNFRASKKAVDDFWPGRLSLTDEATGTVYSQVPSMPVVGLLIGRPKRRDQVGYVMFTNNPPLPPGSLVTVRLGAFEQEHVRVEQ